MEQAKVLLVEDDQRLCEVIALFLSETFEIRRARTGDEALGVLDRERVGAVLLDYRLPGRLSGLDVLASIRSRHPRLPVVMMTGYGSERLVASALKLGISDYFPKPVSVDEIFASLKKILSPSPRAGSRVGDQLPPLEARPFGNVLDLPIQRLVKMIQLKAAEVPSLSELARELGVSKYHLSHRFKQALGMTFRTYVLRVRLDRAISLLKETELPITEVAFMTGFSDLARFDKLFKRYTGLTPSAYRARPSNATTPLTEGAP